MGGLRPALSFLQLVGRLTCSPEPSFLLCLQMPPFLPLPPLLLPSATPLLRPRPRSCSLVLFWPRGAVVGPRHLHQGSCKTLVRASVSIMISFISDCTDAHTALERSLLPLVMILTFNLF